ncbi:PH domain-containing protein [Haloarcula argentinensis]|uniref:PH domain-containing protein n=1 Tax=Haloarcula argentinensis TaxID=43776 RepID=A0A847URQ4_HALAR|nr:PH domain-containing protein [Haloarcula argentinensis]NLV14388.1 PH domain-containing protein [Haloarcula argentinensis]
MSNTALQDTPKPDSADTVDLDLGWLTLEDDESIQWASTPHKYSLVPALIIGIPLSLVLIGIPILVSSYLQYTNTNYVVTNRGLYSKRGILSRDVQQIGFDKIQNISYSQSALGSSFGYGSVDISTAGGSGVELKFRSIPDPASVQELIAREVDDRQQSTGDAGADTNDVLDEILHELQAIRQELADNDGNDPVGGEHSSDRTPADER